MGEMDTPTDRDERAERFQPPRMTPEQFHAKLRDVMARARGHHSWRDLPYFTRQQLSDLEDDFARMIEPFIGKNIRKL